MLDGPLEPGQIQLSRVLEAESEHAVLEAAVAFVADLLGGTVVGVLRGRAEYISSAVTPDQSSQTASLFIEALRQIDARLVGSHNQSTPPPEGQRRTLIVLREGDRVLGAICAAVRHEPLSEHEEAQIAVLQLAFARTLQRIRRLAETKLLYEISLRLGNKLDIIQLVREVLDLVRETFGARSSRVFLNDGRTGSLAMLSADRQADSAPGPQVEHPAEASPDDWTLLPKVLQDPLVWPQVDSALPALDTIQIPIEGTVAGQVVQRGEGCICNDPSAAPFAEIERETGVPLGKLVCVPLKHYSRVLGALMLINRHDDPDFTPDDQRLLATIGGIIAIMLANARLYQRAVRDALTGAYNRGAFELRLREHWARWEEHGEGFALFVLDLDNFKQVNDRFGHATGDVVLRAVTRLLWETLREDDSIFRYGGEEFCVVLSQVVDLDLVERVAERIRMTLDREVVISSLVRIKISASIGVAMHPRHGASSPQMLLDLADDASYQAKRLGKNQVAIAPFSS